MLTYPLLKIIRELLSEGPLPASEFMALALYHPEHGYYRQGGGRWGFGDKDYFTALDLGPLLGETVVSVLYKEWLALDRPTLFTVLEPGAGRGWLGRDILSAATGDFVQSLRYIHCDDNPAASEAATEALEPWLNSGQACLVKQFDEIDAFVGAVVSNELFDALPAQPWRWGDGQWGREVLVSLDADGLACTQWETANPGEAGAWFAEQAEGGLQPGDGSIWAESLPGVLGRICKPLKKGIFLAIDYGDSADRLIAKGADLRRYSGHQVDGRWWEAPGTSDITADVDFSRLALLLGRLGIETEKHVSLGHWVCANAPLALWEKQWPNLSQTEQATRKHNLMQLTLPDAMGDRFKVIQGRAASGCVILP
jgi:SAM-dependent MidA family methyltransferase